jgi:uncharacterized protein (TIGR02246 family)
MSHCRMLILCALLLSMVGGCARQPAPDTRAEDENVIREMENEAWKIIQAKDLDGFMSYYAEDALALYSNKPVLTGKDAIRENWTATFAQPGFAMSGQPVKVDVSRGGDMAYVQGIYALASNDAAGKPLEDKGKYVVIYRKGADGKWKVVIDIGNSDLPPAQ